MRFRLELPDPRPWQRGGLAVLLLAALCAVWQSALPWYLALTCWLLAAAATWLGARAQPQASALVAETDGSLSIELRGSEQTLRCATGRRYGPLLILHGHGSDDRLQRSLLLPAQLSTEHRRLLYRMLARGCPSPSASV